jgi:hypothetical protein
MERDVGDNELWEELGAVAGCCGATALGHYAAFTGRYGERLIRGKIAGRLDQLQDATIEKWAHWRGTPGALASALRALCTDPDSGELKGFRSRNAKILGKQLRDARKRAPRTAGAVRTEGGELGKLLATRVPARVPARVLTKDPRANDDDDGNEGNAPASSGGKAEDTPSSISREAFEARCIAACNQGLRSNAAVVTHFDELVAHSDEASTAWFDEGVPIEVAEKAIYVRASRYSPTSSSRQPRSLRYFDTPVREAWAREVARPMRTLRPVARSRDAPRWPISTRRN